MIPRAERRLTGIGGAVDTYVIKDSRLLFTTEQTVTIEEEMPVYVAHHRMEKLKPEIRALIMRLPSLLGRDLINNYRLFADAFTKTVILEKPTQR